MGRSHKPLAISHDQPPGLLGGGDCGSRDWPSRFPMPKTRDQKPRRFAVVVGAVVSDAVVVGRAASIGADGGTLGTPIASMRCGADVSMTPPTLVATCICTLVCTSQ